jgi:hypothetical protein
VVLHINIVMDCVKFLVYNRHDYSILLFSILESLNFAINHPTFIVDYFHFWTF